MISALVNNVSNLVGRGGKVEGAETEVNVTKNDEESCGEEALELDGDADDEVDESSGVCVNSTPIRSTGRPGLRSVLQVLSSYKKNDAEDISTTLKTTGLSGESQQSVASGSASSSSLVRKYSSSDSEVFISDAN